MPNLLHPTKSDAERALQQLKEAEIQFQEAVAYHDAEAKHGDARLAKAASRLAKASRAYRHALLEPRLPPI